MRHIFTTSGESLVFPDEELYQEYKEATEELYAKTYMEIREMYGIWASNQGKFVQSVEELNEWDSKHMENLRLKYHIHSR